ncbi:MAG: gamma-glutamyl-gamma-aminobutyrate hydrolase family protein [Solirubrobacteraceae bacterium]
MSGPLIGISTSELRTPDRVDRDPDAEPPQRELALGLDYPNAVAAAGGLPVVLPPHLDLALEMVGRLDGLLLSGGPDLDPALYAAAPNENLGPIEPATDRWELALLQAALEHALPVLAICRGMQLLNVAYGGTLWQDLPSETGVDEHHRQKARGSEVTHEVVVEEGTKLAALTRGGRVAVNSFHHQAVKRLGSGLVVSARDDDGLVEAVEDPDRPFVVGVQWHAESLQSRAEHSGLFRGLIAAASGVRA